jgi:hypothetical protein
MMKKSLFRTGKLILLAVGLIAVISACKKENGPSELRAVMNDFANSGQKAYIDPKQYSCFVINEKVRVNSSTGTITALTRNDRQCTIDGVPEVSSYKAFYPYHLLVDSATVDLSGGLNDKAVYFPQVQQYKTDANGIQKIDNPMIAELSGFGSNNNTLHFRNLCALLKITVRTLDAFDAIHVTMSGQKLWGFGKISGSKVVMNINAANDSETVILSLPTGHSGSPAGEAFYIMIPEVSLSNSSVTVSIMNGSTVVKTYNRTGVTGTLAYNLIHTLGNFTFNAPVFSVAPDKTVVFAPGNLQFQSKGCIQQNDMYNGDLVGGMWRFAEHQWDFIGNNPGNSITDRKTRRDQWDWIDYFTWGSSGWNSGAALWTPFNVGKNDSNYNPGKSYINDLTGQYARADWGVFNKIYNTTTKVNDPAGTWYTMPKEEWAYLLDSNRTSSGKRFALAKVGDVNGMLIFPDGWDSTWYRTKNDNNYTASYGSNTMTVAVFQQQLESRGVAFLPAAGNQSGSIGDPLSGSYWSSSHSDVEYKDGKISKAYAYGLYFTNRGNNLQNVGSSGKHQRGHGRCVRLVRVVE